MDDLEQIIPGHRFKRVMKADVPGPVRSSTGRTGLLMEESGEEPDRYREPRRHPDLETLRDGLTGG
jgi:hypothetical protein